MQFGKIKHYLNAISCDIMKYWVHEKRKKKDILLYILKDPKETHIAVTTILILKIKELTWEPKRLRAKGLNDS